MNSFSSLTQLLLPVTLGITALIGLVFYVLQNRQRSMGGAISAPKALWLTYAIYAWFIATPILALDAALDPTLALTLQVFAVSMWVRGLVELYMLYVSKNWIPPYGIAHDLLSLLFVGTGLVLSLQGNLDWTSTVTLASVGWLSMLLLSLMCETYYALHFHEAVKGKTTGDEGVWFADQESQHFRFINRVTAIFNAPLVGYTLVMIVWVNV